MNIHRKLLSELGLNILDKTKRYTINEYLTVYHKSLRWSGDELQNYQVEKLRRLLISANSNVSYYRKLFNEAGFNPEKFNYPDKLKSIPPLTRNDLQNNLNGLLSSVHDLSLCKKGSSSGSTGHPVIYYHDKNSLSAYKAAVLFQKQLAGYKPGDLWMNIWGNPTTVNIEWKKLGSRISKYLANEIRFPAYKLNQKESMEQLVNILLTKKPKFIYGYTNAIYLLAEYLDAKSIRIDFVQGIFSTAENLQEFQRSLITQNIGRVFDHYGCSEISGIAAQTQLSEEYLILDPHVYVEFGDVVDPRTGMRKLIITDLNNYVLPFIRYENGDLATPGATANSTSSYSKIRSIDGRLSDIIKLPSGGTLVVPSFFGSRMLKNIDGVKQYQIVKYSADKIRINLAVNGHFNNSSKDIINNTLKEYLPKDLQYDLVFDDKFIYSQNNKFKLFIDTSS